jgi:glycosyltransferase involved in cell wall biosynthesis
MTWEGHTVFPAGIEPYGGDVLPGHAAAFGADLVLTLMDLWVLGPGPLQDRPSAAWLPVDCAPLSLMDARALEGGTVPVAMSRFGQRMLADAGWTASYVPHGIDTRVFAPGDKAAARAEIGLPGDAYVIGLNATNIDAVRKGFAEQFWAFAMFLKDHPDALLLVHTQPSGYSAALDLRELAARLQIGSRICWTDYYKYATGAYSPGDMARWYAALDLYSGCSYGEGFGLPLIEAQACGIPVVATDGSAMTEVAGPHAYLTGSEPFWNASHRSFWTKPHIAEIHAAYNAAYAATPDREALRAHALVYDADLVFAEYWKPVMAELEEGCR